MTDDPLEHQERDSIATLKTRALRGAGWTLGGFGFSRVLRLLNHLVLAWLLTPQIFGLMALVKVFGQGLQMFSDVGIQPAIIRSPRGLDPQFLNTAWTIQVIRGIGLWILTCLCSVPFAWLYAQKDPAAWQLVFLLPVAGVSAVLSGFESTSLAILSKEIRLARITMLQISTQLVTLTAILLWASIQPSIWAMVAGGLFGGIFRLIASHRLVAGHRPSFAWNRDCVIELFSFGKWIFLSTTFTFLSLNTDKLLLGRLLSLSDLGVYVIAAVFAKAALDVAMRLGNNVMFPVYSQLQGDPDRLMTVALKARRMVLWLGGCACICFAVCGPVLFESLWDERYHAAGQISQWLAIYIWARILLHSMDRILPAMGNSRSLFLSNVVRFSGIIPAIAGYGLAGLPGFIVGLSIGPLAAHVVLIFSLPSCRTAMLVQTLQFSSVFVLLGASMVFTTIWVRGNSSHVAWILSVAITCLSISATAVWVNRGLLPERVTAFRSARRDGVKST